MPLLSRKLDLKLLSPSDLYLWHQSKKGSMMTVLKRMAVQPSLRDPCNENCLYARQFACKNGRWWRHLHFVSWPFLACRKKLWFQWKQSLCQFAAVIYQYRPTSICPRCPFIALANDCIPLWNANMCFGTLHMLRLFIQGRWHPRNLQTFLTCERQMQPSLHLPRIYHTAQNYAHWYIALWWNHILDNSLLTAYWITDYFRLLFQDLR